jgi:hypothetical protein
MDLENVLQLSLEIRQAFNALVRDSVEMKNDCDFRHLLKQRFETFSREYPQLFSFLCNSSTTEQNVMDMQRAIELKIDVLRGTISDEVGKERLLKLLQTKSHVTPPPAPTNSQAVPM